MSRDLMTALALLPETYAVALRLQVAGATREEISDRLGLEPTAIEPLLHVADAKLRALLLDERR